MVISPTKLQSAADAVGGYAKAQSADEQEALRRTLAEHLVKMQLIVTSAQIPGKRAPLLIDEAAISRLSPGAVIVDLAEETGGNCALTKPNEVVVVGGTILGPTNLAASLPTDASRRFSGNVRAVIEHIVTEDGALSLDAVDPSTGPPLAEEARATAAA